MQGIIWEGVTEKVNDHLKGTTTGAKASYGGSYILDTYYFKDGDISTYFWFPFW